MRNGCPSRVVGSRVVAAAISALLAVACGRVPATNAAKRQAAADNRQPAKHTLRVCADPNNLPYSNRQLQGFENRIAALLARHMGAKLEYTWWPQRRGFARMTLKQGDCDVVMGIPSSYELAQATEPYYRSSYVFVSRHDRNLGVTSLDDPRLHKLKIGVQIVGDDGANTPPVHALNSRGMVGNLVGYPVYGDYSQPSPTRNIVDAVARGDVDLAIVWGPQAGWFARQQKTALDIVPVSPQIDLPFLPFVFDISMGVRRGDQAMREALDREIDLRRGEIERILDEYGVPRV